MVSPYLTNLCRGPPHELGLPNLTLDEWTASKEGPMHKRLGKTNKVNFKRPGSRELEHKLSRNNAGIPRKKKFNYLSSSDKFYIYGEKIIYL